MERPEPIDERYQIPKHVYCWCCREIADESRLKYKQHQVCGVACLTHLAAGKDHHK